ncbi:MAG: DUF4465 domain-containing protein [Sedimentisphaerales bacterium]|nr:DUF4465 domain-containing protein [Sedimentisphaerales bacterium]
MASEMVMRALAAVFVFLLCGVVKAEGIADFEDLSLETQSYWNGSDGSGGFASGRAWFYNHYNTTYGSWAGFAYSNISDSSATGWTSQYNAITGGGQGGSTNYAVGYGYEDEMQPPTMILEEPTLVSGLYVTNNNYAYYSMRDGDMFAKKFGGSTGGDPDWFLLTMTGKDELGEITGSVDFYLADFRFADNQMDYIVNDWRFADLSPLGVVKSVEFCLSSSDMGTWGMNTPGYFVIDIVVPEPATLVFMGFGVLGVLRRCKR